MDDKSPFEKVEEANFRANKGKGKGRKNGQGSKFMAKAKKFAKQGRLGRGFEIDKDTYDYFLRVLELSRKNEFETDEDRESFIVNSFIQTEGNEVNYSSNQMTSRVLESLLPSANEEILIRFTSAFSESLRTICPDPFASHVLEKLLEVTSSDKWIQSAQLNEWFRQTSQYILNNFEEFTFDNYANHAMRKVCQCLSGLVVPSGQGMSAGKAGPTESKEAQSIFGERQKNPKREEMLRSFYQRFMDWPQFFDLFKKELTCGFVQSLLKNYHRLDPEGVQGGIDKTVKALGDRLDLTQTLIANLHTRTIEVCLSLSNKTRWMSIYKKFFQDELIKLGLHEKGIFCVKKLVESCPNKEMFEKVYEELETAFDQLFRKKHTSVFVTIAEGCKKFQSKQHPFIIASSSMIEDSGDNVGDSGKSKTVKEQSNFILLMAKFGQQSPLKDDGTPLFLTDLSGTMVLQNMMEFHKPLKVITSLIEMDENDLVKLTVDPKGSHILDSFFKSSTIGDKNKDKLLNKLSENMFLLATNKFGSRVIDTMWAWADNKRKGTIAASLCNKVTQLGANQYGKFLCEKLALRAYKHDQSEWLMGLSKLHKRKDEILLLADELGLTESSAKRPKKNKSVGVDADGLKDDAVKVEEKDSESGAEEHSVGRKKKKKKKSKHQDEDEIAVEPTSFVIENTSEPRKKKKSKRQDEDENADVESATFAVENTDEPKKKKKKKKKDEICESTVDEMVQTAEEHEKERNKNEDCELSEKVKKKNKRRVDMNEEEEAEDSEIHEQPKKKKKSSRSSVGLGF